MRNLLVGLFWLWVLVALSIYAYRIWRRVSRGSDKTASDGAPVDPDSPVVSAPAAARPPRPVPRPARPVAPPAAPAPAAEPRSSMPADASSEPGARSGLFAPTPKVGTPGGSDPTTGTTAEFGEGSELRPTVADALSGIAMPCDLTPVVDTGRRLDPYRVAFTTDTSPAAEVGAAVGDELERLGFALASTASNQLAATKDGTRVTVTIHTDPSTVMIAEAPAFPSARPGSLIVEFQT